MTYGTNVTMTNEDGLALITVNRPQALNALNCDTLEELRAAVLAADKDPAVRVIIITGAGAKAFVAGADIAQMRGLSPLEGRDMTILGQEVFAAIENLAKPVIAAINGFALGGGCELAMACDIRLASDKAKFGQPEVSLGITPGFAGTQRLTRLVGRGKAKLLIFSGDIIDAAEALRIGLVDKVVPADELLAAAKALAGRIIAKAPQAVSQSKLAINKGIEMEAELGYAFEAEVFGMCFTTEDQREGMRAFLEKRKPAFNGR